MRQGWGDIPSDLLYEIDAELAYIEKVRIRAACVWWNSILSKMPNQKLPQLPWLLQTTVDSEQRQLHALFNLCDKISYPLDLPQLEGKLLKGSTHGWLATISMDQNDTTPSSPDICLLNPLTGVEVQLPPRSEFPDVVKYNPDRVGEEYSLNEGKDHNGEDMVNDIGSNYVHLNLIHAIVTSSSCIENCVVAALYTGVRKVAWCKPGHDKWTALDIYSSDTSVRPGAVQDLLFSDNKLYILNCQGCLFQVEFLGDSNPKVTILVGQPSERIGEHMFMVEGSDKRLRMAIRLSSEDEIEVLELNLEESCWLYTNNTGDDMLFLGYNQSLSVPTSLFPGYTKNRVYFADDDDLYVHNDGKGDVIIGVYKFEEGCMEKLDGFPPVERSTLPQPIWIAPPSY